jgi:hypothetical protein
MSDKKLTLFERVSREKIKCETCGSETISLPGGGWDYDRIYCSDPNCAAEYVFPTSTDINEWLDDDDK